MQGSLDVSGSTRTLSKCSAERQRTGRGSPGLIGIVVVENKLGDGYTGENGEKKTCVK
jgi:hypothetical protein